MCVWYNGAVSLLRPGSLDNVLRAQNPWWLTGVPVSRGAAARPRALDARLASDERPILLRQESRAGHGVGKPLHKQADEAADQLAFCAWQLGGLAGVAGAAGVAGVASVAAGAAGVAPTATGPV